MPYERPQVASEVIATRTFHRSNGGATVTAELHRPEFVAEGEWRCEYRIVGLTREPITGRTSGVDAFQAIILTIKIVGTIIYTSEDAKSKALYWLEPGGGFGLLLPSSVHNLYRGDDPP
jgi:hypothetical protein